MGLAFESRPSDSPYIDRVWRSRAVDVDSMTSIARAQWDLVFWEFEGHTYAGIQGPESKASPAPVPPESVTFGIRFCLGASMTAVPVTGLVDAFVAVPCSSPTSFRLPGSRWRIPDFDNAEVFVQRLVRAGVLIRDPAAARMLGEEAIGRCPRTIQRRFRTATGLTRGVVRQILRAQRAAILIQDGTPTHEVLGSLGYFDQAHLARSLTRFIGRTATDLRSADPSEPLSLLYKP